MSKLVRLTIIKRYMTNGFLYLKTRAYKVTSEQADELCMLEHRDMPIFKVVTEDKLEAEEIAVSIIDLTGGSLDEAEEELEEETEVATPSPKKKVAKKKVAKKKVAPKKKISKKKKAPVADDNIELV